MQLKKCVRLLIAAIAIAVGGAAVAEEAPFGRRADVVVHVDSANQMTVTYAEDIVLKTTASVQMFGQLRLFNNDHFWDLEIAEAYTLKADGRKISVDPVKILQSALPNANEAAFFMADVKISTIVYPEVAVGDSIHYRAIYHPKGHVLGDADNWTFTTPLSARYDGYSITLDAPAGSAARGEARGFNATHDEKDGRIITHWILPPQTYRADERGALSAFDHDPSVVVTSYPDWNAIGEAYFKGVEAAGAVTPEVKQLAETITAGITDRRAQAQAIFDWTRKNIRYMAIFVGQGGFVPHSAASVIANRYGDCKDHTTLMRALLAAKGIDADILFVTLANSYRRTEVPSTGWQNHVIVYVPEFDIYADPTDPVARFGETPVSVSGKPALRMGAHGTSLVDIPRLAADEQTLAITTDVTLRPDGTTFGTNQVSGTGRPAYMLRWQAQSARQTGAETAVKNALLSQNWRGTGSLDLPEDADASPFVIKSSFDQENNFLKEDVNINSVPTGPRFIGLQLPLANAYLSQKHTLPTTCFSETVSETIDFHVPDGLSITNIPKGLTIDKPSLRYRSSYTMDGSTLQIRRAYSINLPGPVCNADVIGAARTEIQTAYRDLSYHPQFAKKDGVTAQ